MLKIILAFNLENYQEFYSHILRILTSQDICRYLALF
jgi:hypothetical protein